jgi:hypothetical protein
MKLLNRLTYLSKNLQAASGGELGIILDQKQECALEVGIDQNAFLIITISVDPEPTRALKVACESL